MATNYARRSATALLPANTAAPAAAATFIISLRGVAMEMQIAPRGHNRQQQRLRTDNKYVDIEAVH